MPDETARRIAAIFELPCGATLDDLPTSPATWFGLEECLTFALRRASESDVVAPDAFEDARSTDTSDALPPPDDDDDDDVFSLAGLGDGLLAALAGLRGAPSAPSDTMIGDLPAPGVDHPNAGLATVVRQLQGLELGGLDVSRHLDATRRLAWRLRIVTTLTADSDAARERRMRVAFEAVGEWLREVLGERASILDDADRLVVVPGLSLALLGLVERSRALEHRCAAVGLLLFSGRLDGPAARRELGRALLSAPEPAQRARRRTALQLGATPLDVAAAMLTVEGAVDLDDARQLLVSPERASDPAWPALFERVVQRLEGAAAVELVLELGVVPATPPGVLGVLARERLTAAQRVRAAHVVAAHGQDSLDDLGRWVERRAAVDAAHDALDAGQAVEALRALRSVGDSEPEAMVVAAQAHERLGQPERAWARYEQLAGRGGAISPAVYAGLGRTGLALGRPEAAELLELAFQSGHEASADARLLIEHYLATGELVAAERWLEVREELRTETGADVALHEQLARRAVEQGEAMVASGELEQAEGLLELASRHAGRLAGRVALSRLRVVEQGHGRGAALEMAAALEPPAAEALARATLEALASQDSREDAERAIELGDALRECAPRAVWPFVLLTEALWRAGQSDAALSAGEGGLMQCSGQIAADEPGGLPAPLDGRLWQQREDAAVLYRRMSEVHLARGDHAAASQMAARSLAHLGRLPSLVELAGRLLTAGEGDHVRSWEMGMMSVLGPSAVGAIVEALRARVSGGVVSEERGATAEASAAVPGPIGRMLAACGVDAMYGEPALVVGLEEHLQSLWGKEASRAVEIVTRWLASPPELEAVASRRQVSRLETVSSGPGRGTVMVGPTVPVPATTWTVQRIDKASAAFDDDGEDPGGGGRGSSS